jgi:nucleoside-diphosphate-sugar epimerase
VELISSDGWAQQMAVDEESHVAVSMAGAAAPVVLLPLRLAELGMQRGVRCFINTDSFFNKGGHSYSNLLNYSLSKKSLLIWLDKLAGELGILNVVLEHLYGPGDSPSKFVEHVVRQVGVEHVPHIALTHGHQRRDFVFLEDVVAAYLKLVDYGRAQEFRFETFELGTGQSMQVRDFVDQIKSLSSSPTKLGFGDIAYRSDEIMSSHADISRLERLGWRPAVGAAEGIRRILDNYCTPG